MNCKSRTNENSYFVVPRCTSQISTRQNTTQGHELMFWLRRRKKCFLASTWNMKESWHSSLQMCCTFVPSQENAFSNIATEEHTIRSQRPKPVRFPCPPEEEQHLKWGSTEMDFRSRSRSRSSQFFLATFLSAPVLCSRPNVKTHVYQRNWGETFCARAQNDHVIVHSHGNVFLMHGADSLLWWHSWLSCLTSAFFSRSQWGEGQELPALKHWQHHLIASELRSKWTALWWSAILSLKKSTQPLGAEVQV